MDVRDKNIVITGASSGIGASLAKHLAAKVKTLVLIARRENLLEKLSQELKEINPAVNVICFPSDITLFSNQQEVISTLNNQNISIDILINNAGVGDAKYFHESSIEKLNQLIELNVKSVVSFTYLIVKEMITFPSGKGILFVGSGAGIAWMPGSTVYSASKHFITGFAMNLMSELAPYGIKVSLTTPGPVDSEFDRHAGIEGGMKGGPSQNTRISSDVCAKDILHQLTQSKTLILPGGRIRRLMKLYINLPWFIRKKLVLSEGKKMFQQKNKSK